MTNRSIYHNVYALLQKKHKHLWLLFFSLVLFGLFGKLLFQETVQLLGTYQGLYQCGKTCTLELTMSVDDVRYFQKELEVYVHDEKISVQSIDFGEVEVIYNIPVQTLKLVISKQDWYNKQPVEVKIVLRRESIGKKIIDVLRGGDDRA